MTEFSVTLDHELAGQTGEPVRVLIAANASDLESLRSGLRAIDFADFDFASVDCDENVPEQQVASAQILIIEADQANPKSLLRISSIRRSNEDLVIVAALRDAGLSAVRTLLQEGISDVVRLPFDPEEVLARLADIASSLSPSDRLSNLAPLVCVVGSVGGCGTTTVLAHLAAQLGRMEVGEKGVCVVDLDLQAGEMACYLGLLPKISVTTLIDAGDRLDRELVRSATCDSGHGFSLVAAPETITALDDVSDDQLLRLLVLLRQQFDFVLVDLPTDWTNWGLSIVFSSSKVLMITGLGVASLRQAKRRLELFDTIGLEQGKVMLIANRVERKFFRSIGISQAEDVLGRKVMAVIADESREMAEAQDEGRLITDVKSHSRFASDIEKLAKVLLGERRVGSE